jgi:hypothetical protein
VVFLFLTKRIKTMSEEHTENAVAISAMMKTKKDMWCKKKKHLYESLIALADLNDSKLSDSEEENLEYAMEKILQYGTYAENAKALKMYGQYLNLYDFLDD